MHGFRHWLHTVETHRLTLGLFTAAVLTAVALLRLVPDRVSLQLGDPSPVEVVAPRTTLYEDEAATERIRKEALSVREYDWVPNATGNAQTSVEGVFARLANTRTRLLDIPAADRVRHASEALTRDRLQLTGTVVTAVLNADAATLELMQIEAIRLVLDVMGQREGIRQGTYDVQKASDAIAAGAEALRFRPELREFVRRVAQAALQPTLIYSERKTEQARNRILAQLEPVTTQIYQGDVVVRKGETVTRTHLNILTALGLRHQPMDPLTAVYLLAFATGIVAIIGTFVYRYHRRIYNDRRLLWLLALVVMGLMLFYKLGGTALGIKLDSNQFGYFGVFCVSTAAMLIAVLLHPALAVVVASLLSLHVGIMTSNDLRFAGVALISSLVGIMGFANIRDRGDLVRTLLILCVANIAGIWILGSITGNPAQDLLMGVAWGIGASVLSCLGTWLGVALLERPFGITTHIGLLELSDMNQPALRRLLQDAPGTYIHSLNVGQLAEAAAEAIGADSLLARVGAYYHDIGKVMRPYCFVENQTADNIHNRLNPTLSTLVVTSHIKDGVDMAHDFRLPAVIVDIIRSHHGTGLVKYFYHQAMLASEGDSPVPEHDFRYEGPRPRSKEAGIIMLADSVEGAVRSALADRPDPTRIQAIVTRIVRDKTSDGQLDECDLTFRDLSKVAAAFTRILQSIHHARIKYPEVLTAEGQKLNAISDSTAAEHREGAIDAGGSGESGQRAVAP